MPVGKLKRKKFAAGEMLFSEGDAGGEAYWIRKGSVSVWRQDGDRKVHLAIRAEGDIVGEMALLDSGKRSASVTAQGDVVVDVITPQTMKTMVAKIPKPLAAVINQLMESLRTADDLIAMYASRPSGGR